MKPGAHRSIRAAGSLFLLLAANSVSAEPITFHYDSLALDPEIPESVRRAFEDDDGSPMKSISVDLNGDGIPEKLVLNEFLCGNGSCPWLVYSPTLDKVIGHLEGSRIVVLDAMNDGHRSISTYT